MADPFALFHARLLAILCEGRGADGSLGADAQARAIAAGRLRYSAVSLSDAGLSGNAFDRALHLRGWLLDSGGAGPLEPMFPTREQMVSVDVCVGYLQSPPMTNLVHLAAGETAFFSVTEPGIRAARDFQFIERALRFPALLQGDLGGGNKFINASPQGPLRTENLGGGRAARVQSYRLHTYITNTQ